MSENSNPSVRGGAPRFGRALPIMVVVNVALLTISVWMVGRQIQQHRNAGRERDFWVLCQPGSTPLERETIFRRLVAAGNREWRAADLRGLNLAGMALAGADLQNA